MSQSYKLVDNSKMKQSIKNILMTFFIVQQCYSSASIEIFATDHLIEENKVPTAGHVKLLGMEIDSKLTFNKHIETLCSKVNKKVSAFARLNNYISREQA